MGYIASSCLKVSFSVGPVVRVLYQGRSTCQSGESHPKSGRKRRWGGGSQRFSESGTIRTHSLVGGR